MSISVPYIHSQSRKAILDQNMSALIEEQYQKFGKDFLDFYMENGFGNKSKKEIKLKFFLLLSQSFKEKKSISLARELGIPVAKLKNLAMQTRLIGQLTSHYTGVSFSKIPDIFGSILEQLKNKIKKE